MTICVFGRTEYAEPLVDIGTIEDDADPTVAFPADWVELVMFRQDEIHWIIRDGARQEA
jgi:hypothetical protein